MNRIKLLLNKLLIKKTQNTVIQFVRYFFVGGIAAIINICSLYIFTEIFNFFYLISNIIGFILGLATNYILSKKLVFSLENDVNKYLLFIIYGIIGIIGLLIDTLLVWIISEKLFVYYMLSKIISTAIVFVWNFVARKIMYLIIEKLNKKDKNNI